MHAINPVFFLAVQNLTGGRIPLTGLAAIAVAIRSCRTVRVYGFTTDDARACRYYWDCSATDYQYNRYVGAGYHDFVGSLRALRVLNHTRRILWRDD